MPTPAFLRCPAYDSEGCLFPLPVLAAEEVGRFRAGYEEAANRLGGRPPATKLFLLHLYHRWAWDVVTHPKILDHVQSALGPNLLVWDSSVFVKHPRSGSFVSMHQDGTYWGLEGGEVTTAWLAITESSPQSGGMRFVRGSHRQAILPHVDTHAPGNLLTRGQSVRAAIAPEDVVDVPLKPGEMSLHHVRLIHGSNANSTEEPRIGFAIRYVTPEVKPRDKHHPAVLARGGDIAGHWQVVEGPPRYESFDAAHEAQQEAARRHLEELTS